MSDRDEIKGYRDLKVWQRAMDAAEMVMEMVDTGPLANKPHLAGQWQASSASVPTNISEGRETATSKQYLAHLHYARSSLAETLTFLELFQRRKLVETERARTLWNTYIEVRKMLYDLINSLEGRRDQGDENPDTGNLEPGT